MWPKALDLREIGRATSHWFGCRVTAVSRQRVARGDLNGARSCPGAPPVANATCGTPPNCATPRGHQTIREAVKRL
jgi:hypothetical protein